MTAKIFRTVMYQFFFLASGQVFDGVFPAHGLFFRGKSFIIDELYRDTASGILPAASFIVYGYAFLQIVRPAGVIGIVAAFQDICVIQ